MKKVFKYCMLLMSVLVVSITISSCEKDPDDPQSEKREAFLATSSISVFVKGATVYEFNKELQQIAYTADKKMYLVTNFEQTEHYSLTMDAAPAVNATVNVTFTTLGITSLSNASYSMETLRVSANKMWLWDNTAGVGFVVDFL